MSILSVSNLEKRYGNDIILHGINADIEKGEVISIIGPSGTGKSTFLRTLNYLDPPTDGEIFFDGEKITNKNVDAIRRRMGMVFQNFGLFSHLDVLSNITAGPIKLMGVTKHDADKRAYELLRTVGLAQRAHFFPNNLSGGQKQRVAIARCLAMNPEVILFDEPTSALDPTMVSEVMAVMRNLAKSGMTMLIVTHEMDFAREISSRIMYMDGGGIYEQGTPHKIFEKPQRPKTRDFIFKIRSYTYDIASREFDYVQMLSGLENFCYRNAINKTMTNRLRLVAEELVINIVTPKYGACSLVMSFSKKLESYELAVSYSGENENALQTAEDELSATMVLKCAKNIRHEYADGRNTLTAAL